jgi:hypothetical protein
LTTLQLPWPSQTSGINPSHHFFPCRDRRGLDFQDNAARKRAQTMVDGHDFELGKITEEMENLNTDRNSRNKSLRFRGLQEVT